MTRAARAGLPLCLLFVMIIVAPSCSSSGAADDAATDTSAADGGDGSGANNKNAVVPPPASALALDQLSRLDLTPSAGGALRIDSHDLAALRKCVIDNKTEVASGASCDVNGDGAVDDDDVAAAELAIGTVVAVDPKRLDDLASVLEGLDAAAAADKGLIKDFNDDGKTDAADLAALKKVLDAGVEAFDVDGEAAVGYGLDGTFGQQMKVTSRDARLAWIAAAWPADAPTPSPTEGLDADADGDVDADDAVLVTAAAQLSAMTFAGALDTNGDTVVDIDDYSALLHPELAKPWLSLLVGEQTAAGLSGEVDVRMMRPDGQPISKGLPSGDATMRRIMVGGLRVNAIDALPDGWAGQYAALIADDDPLYRVEVGGSGEPLKWIDIYLPGRNDAQRDQGVALQLDTGTLQQEGWLVFPHGAIQIKNVAASFFDAAATPSKEPEDWIRAAIHLRSSVLADTSEDDKILALIDQILQNKRAEVNAYVGPDPQNDDCLCKRKKEERKKLWLDLNQIATHSRREVARLSELHDAADGALTAANNLRIISSREAARASEQLANAVVIEGWINCVGAFLSAGVAFATGGPIGLGLELLTQKVNSALSDPYDGHIRYAQAGTLGDSPTELSLLKFATEKGILEPTQQDMAQKALEGLAKRVSGNANALPGLYGGVKNWGSGMIKNGATSTGVDLVAAATINAINYGAKKYKDDTQRAYAKIMAAGDLVNKLWTLLDEVERAWRKRLGYGRQLEESVKKIYIRYNDALINCIVNSQCTGDHLAKVKEINDEMEKTRARVWGDDWKEDEAFRAWKEADDTLRKKRDECAQHNHVITRALLLHLTCERLSKHPEAHPDLISQTEKCANKPDLDALRSKLSDCLTEQQNLAGARNALEPAVAAEFHEMTSGAKRQVALNNAQGVYASTLQQALQVYRQCVLQEPEHPTEPPEPVHDPQDAVAPFEDLRQLLAAYDATPEGTCMPIRRVIFFSKTNGGNDPKQLYYIDLDLSQSIAPAELADFAQITSDPALFHDEPVMTLPVPPGMQAIDPNKYLYGTAGDPKKENQYDDNRQVVAFQIGSDLQGNPTFTKITPLADIPVPSRNVDVGFVEGLGHIVLYDGPDLDWDGELRSHCWFSKGGLKTAAFFTQKSTDTNLSGDDFFEAAFHPVWAGLGMVLVHYPSAGNWGLDYVYAYDFKQHSTGVMIEDRINASPVADQDVSEPAISPDGFWIAGGGAYLAQKCQTSGPVILNLATDACRQAPPYFYADFSWDSQYLVFQDDPVGRRIGWWKITDPPDQVVWLTKKGAFYTLNPSYGELPM